MNHPAQAALRRLSLPLRWQQRLLSAMLLLAGLWLVGWSALPWAVRPELERQATRALGRQVSVGHVSFYPWSLEAEVSDIRIATADGQGTQFSLASAYVDAEMMSLLRLAPVIDAVRLQNPVLNLSVDAGGHLDVQDIIDRLASPPDQPEKPPARFAVYNIELDGGQITVADLGKQQQHTVADLHISVPFVSTLGDARQVKVQPALAFTLNGSPFASELTTRPFDTSHSTEAALRFDKLDLTPYLAYLPANLPVRPVQAVLDADLRIAFTEQPTAQVHVKGQIGARELAVTDAQARPLLELAHVHATLDDVRPLERVAQLGTISLRTPAVHLSRDANGRLNLEALTQSPAKDTNSIAKTPNKTSGEAEKDIKKSTSSDWHVSVQSVQVDDGLVHWHDAAAPTSRGAPSALTLDKLQARLARVQLPLPTQADQATTLELDAQLSPAANAPASAPPSTTPAKAAKGTKPSHAKPPAVTKAAAAPAQAAATSAPVHLSATVLAAQAQATVTLEGVELPWLAGYAATQLQPTVAGQLALKAKASWQAAADARSPDDIRLDIERLDLNALRLTQGQQELASLKALTVQDTQVQPLANRARIGRVSLERPDATLHRLADGRLNVQTWFVTPAATATTADTTAPSAAAPAWRWQLDELAVQNGQLAWQDDTPGQPVQLRLQAIQASAKGLASAGKPGQVDASLRMLAGRTEPGTLSWRGSVGLGDDGQTPQAKGQLTARRLPAHALTPYVAQQLNLTLWRADTSFAGQVAFQAAAAGPTASANGDLTIEDFRADTLAQGDSDADELLHWKTLNLKGLDVRIAPKAAPQVSVQSGALSDFFARLVIQENGRFNLQDLVRTANAAPTGSDPSATPPPPPSASASAGPAPLIRIGPFSLVNGHVAFFDRFIRPNYQADLSDLTGRLGGFASDSGKGPGTAPDMADLELRGRAEGTASLAITGKINPLATPLALDIEGKVRDLELSPLSPYSVKYTGHGIQRGKLSMDVAYAIQPDGKLTARNQLVLNQLTFGEAVPGAPTSLPVKLAVALLADRKGVIDLDIPISGSLNDPQFSLVPIFFKIIGNLVVKAITAPFALLASALGGDADELADVGFAPGTAQLLPESVDKLARVAKVLTDKPNLTLTVAGSASLDDEAEAIRRARLMAQVRGEQRRAQGGEPTASTDGAAPPADLPRDDYVKWLTAVYKRADMPKPRNALGLLKDIPPQDMEALLLTQMQVNDTQVQALAVQRGVTVRDHLARLGVATQRLFLGSPEAANQPSKVGPASAHLKLSVQ